MTDEDLLVRVIRPDILALDQLRAWYNHFFHSTNTSDYREKLITLLRDSRFGDKEYTPYWVYLKIVYEYNKHEIQKDLEGGQLVKLASFQQEGAIRALSIVEEFGGVMIADAVGLGKSYMGASILRSLCIRSQSGQDSVLVVCPAQLRKNWDKILDDFGLGSAKIVSQEMLSRDLETSGLSRKSFDIVLIDESHNFRRHKPKRYGNLMNLLTRKDPKVILLTATPINTGYMDLYYQIMLILKNKNQAVADSLDIPDLKEFFDGIEKNKGEDIAIIVDHFLVARSRALIRYRQRVLKQDFVLPNNKQIEFPDRKLSTINYNIILEEKSIEELGARYFPDKFSQAKARLENRTIVQEDETDTFTSGLVSGKITPSTMFYEWIFLILQEWKAAAFHVEEYKLPAKNPDLLEKQQQIIANNRAIAPLMNTTFLKRLESSIKSFIDSIAKQTLFYKFLLTCIDNGYIIASSVIDDIRAQIADEEMLEGDEDPISKYLEDDSVDLDSPLRKVLDVYLSKNDPSEAIGDREKHKTKIAKITPTEFSSQGLNDFKNDIRKDIEILDAIVSISTKVLSMGDHKVDRLVVELKKIIDKAANDVEKKTIIFTIFETTADYIYKYISSNKELMKSLGNPRISIITGRVPKNKRQDIIERFAPESSEAHSPPEEPIEILISTDVLSEGQNLQDAKHVINYDLHWNPVRMIQRAGRIDRLGCLHKTVVIHNFFLEEGLEAILKLMGRIISRLKKIDKAIELDAPVIEMREEYSKLVRIKAEDAKLVDEYEEKLDIVGLHHSKQDLFAAIKQMGIEKFRKTPLGIFSGMQTLDHSGLMVAVDVDRGQDKRPLTIWCYEPDDINKEFPGLEPLSGIIQDKTIIEKIIQCSDKTPRVIVETPEDIYRRATQIVKKIKEHLRQKVVGEMMVPRIEMGNIKYYKIMNKAIKQWGLKAEYAARFIEFLKEKKLENIRKDIKDIIERFNLEMDKIDDFIKKMGEDPNLVNDDPRMNKVRVKTIEDFLDAVYAYFDAHTVDLEKKEEKRVRKGREVKLVGILRVYTDESIKKITGGN